MSHDAKVVIVNGQSKAMGITVVGGNGIVHARSRMPLQAMTCSGRAADIETVKGYVDPEEIGCADCRAAVAAIILRESKT